MIGTGKAIGWCLLLFCFFSCNETDEDTEFYQSSAELVNGTAIPESVGRQITAEKITNVSTEKSRTGNYSVKLDSLHKYGFKTTVDGLQKGAFVQASIWQHQSFHLNGFYGLMKSNDNTEVLVANTFEETGNEWIKQTFEVYVENDSTRLDFYVFSGGKEAYFDDIFVGRFHEVPQVDSITMNGIQSLNLHLPEKTTKLLADFKQRALEKGVISASEKQTLPAFLINKNDSIPIEIRLKGDWTDHLKLGKVSYRIKLKGDGLFMGMKTFSIQHPKTRNYMHEWWMHQLFEIEGLLSTKYQFLPVYINSKNKGIYAIEEHFEQELIEVRGRPTGPILKMDETGLWEHTYLRKSLSNIRKYPIFESSVILPFKKNKTLNNTELKQAFLEGHYLLKMYNNLHRRPEEIFDLDQLAKYYALQELGNIQHAHQWHNNRFYYNPKTKRLELIGFDMNAGHQVNEDLYIVKKLLSNAGPRAWLRILPVLKNQEFKNRYLSYLKAYSDPIFVEKNLSLLESEINLNEKLLGLEVESYKFDKQYYIERAKKIQMELPRIDSIWTAFLLKTQPLSELIKIPVFGTENEPVIVLNASLNSYTEITNKNKWMLWFENYHLNTITIIGYVAKKGKEVYFEEPVVMPQFKTNTLQKTTFRLVDNKPEFILFQAKNIPNKIFKKEVLNWKNCE